MKRLEAAWFSYAGVKSDAMGILLTSMPTRPHPAANGDYEIVPGRDGRMWFPDNTYDQIVVRINCVADGSVSMDDINAWLSGSGDLIFSDEPNRAYRARVTKEFARSPKYARLTAQEFAMSWDCDPYRYQTPETAAQAVSNGSALTNPGAVSLPRITVAGTGDVALTIGSQLIEIEGMTTGVIIDSEQQDAIDYDDGLTLRNDLVVLDEFPKLVPGANVISWSGTGTVSSVTVLPRWRYL